MFHKRQNSFSRHFASEGKIAMKDILPQHLPRYFASEGKIAMEDILPQEEKIVKFANCLAGHGQAGLKMN